MNDNIERLNTRGLKSIKRNTLRFLPPLTITNEEIDLGFARLEIAMQDVK